MQPNVYLNFNGQCETAFKFYEQCLGGRIEAVFTFGSTPAAEQMPPEWRDKIMHASLAIDGATLMGSDAPPGRYQQPQGFSVNLGFHDPEEAQRVYDALSQGATIQMPLQKTFWAEKFAMLVDRFGIPWMINCEAPR